MIYLATDHRGFELKEKIKTWLTEWGLEFVDCGAMSFVATDDYPDYIAIAAEKVSQNPVGNRAIILGGNGQGEAIVANRRRGVRAVVYYGGPNEKEMITMMREHDASNILSIGASFVGDEVKEMIKLWLDTPFSGDERHVRRIAKIDPQ